MVGGSGGGKSSVVALLQQLAHADALISVSQAIRCALLKEPVARTVDEEEAPSLVKGNEEPGVVANAFNLGEALSDGGARDGREGGLDVEHEQHLVLPVLGGCAQSVH